MVLTKFQRKDILIIQIEGSFDIKEISNFEEFFQKIKGNYKVIAFDCEKIDFIDSSGIGAIIKILTYVKQKNGQIIIFSLQPHIETIFQSAKLGLFLKILSKEEFNRLYPDEEEFDDILKRL